MTLDELARGNELNTEIEALSDAVDILEKIDAAWNADYPDATVSTKLVFHYQELRADLELVEVSVNSRTIGALRAALVLIKANYDAMVEEDEIELEELGIPEEE
jgi:hypothetical protein